MNSARPAARAARRCVCQLQARSGPSSSSSSSSSSINSSRQASTSTSVAKTQPATQPGFFKRVIDSVQKGVIERRPPQARMARELQKMELEAGDGSLFERTLAEAGSARGTLHTGKTWTEHKTSTGNIQTSPQKLNELARLLTKRPIDYAILQMQMSDKRLAKSRVKSMLCLARDHAVAKGLDREKLIVREAWVTKGVYLRRLDVKGRGRHGVKMRPESRLHVVLAHGPSRAEIKQKDFDKQVKMRLRTGAGYAREDRPLINLNKLKGDGVAYPW